MTESQTSMTTSAPLESSAQARPRAPFGRRALLTGLGAALSAGARAAYARPDPPNIAADIDPGTMLVKLVQRITFGINETELATAMSLGYDEYITQHLNPAGMSDTASDERIAQLATISMNYTGLMDLNNVSRIRNENTDAVLLRAIYSRRQLFERMVEFWNDHFSMDINNEDNFYLTPPHDRTVIRPNALTTFPRLLSAVAHSPAMLYYLNNDISDGMRPNENFARELVELHTLGPDSGYTQEDIVNIARCFTGWTWWRRDNGDNNGSFRFDPANHDNDEKIVLGRHIAPDMGIRDGEIVLEILANHPATARHIAGKLCRKFVGENCPGHVIAHIARVYTQTGGDIKALLRAMLQPNILALATPKYKRPLHHIASTLRALPTNLVSTLGLRDQLTAAGHRPFFWITPDGYPDTAAYWHGLVLARWNFGAALVQNHIAGVSIDYARFFEGLTTADRMIERIDLRLFGGEMPSFQRQRIRDYLVPDPPTTTQQREAIGLAIGAPAFQWY